MPRRRRRKSSAELAWPLIRDVGAFMLGAGILYDQVVAEEAAQAELVVAALALIGIPAAGSAQRWLQSRLVEEEEEDGA